MMDDPFSKVAPGHARPDWVIWEVGFDPVNERNTEARLAVGNGFLGIRASLEQPTSASRPRTYIAGLFDEDPRDSVGGPSLIPAPDCLALDIMFGERVVSMSATELLDNYRCLDLQSGLLLRVSRHRIAPDAVVTLKSLRLASMANRNLVLQLIEIAADAPLAARLRLKVVPPTDGLVFESKQGSRTSWRTSVSGASIVIDREWALRVQERLAGRDVDPDGECVQWTWDSQPDQPAIFHQVVAFGRGQTDNQQSLLSAVSSTPEALISEHVEQWNKLWQRCDIRIKGDHEAEKQLRFASYHLLSAIDPENEYCSIGARALTGDAYRGHVFWDTDIFLLPFYELTFPKAARALLMYRYHTLDGARRKARRLGWKGALYAWESADTGDETTPERLVLPNGEVIPILCGLQEHHISADVAYAVWHYWQTTGDDDFLINFGSDIVLETARFWASRAQREQDGQYHIRGVIGPDEYHEGVDDNSFTNVMAKWNLDRGLELASMLKDSWPLRWREIQARLDLTDRELETWSEVSQTMTILRDGGRGLLEQFQGFFALDDIDLSLYEPRTAPIDVLLGPDQVHGSQVIKQADVVMLLALLWDGMAPEERRKNFDYYEQRCAHGSSLSPAVHGLVAAKLGDVRKAQDYFHEAGSIDLDNLMGNAAGGIHIATLGGLWQTAIFGFAGVSFGPDGISVDPHLPEKWEEMAFRLVWRSSLVRFEIVQHGARITATLEEGSPVAIRCRSASGNLVPGGSWRWNADTAAR